MHQCHHDRGRVLPARRFHLALSITLALHAGAAMAAPPTAGGRDGGDTATLDTVSVTGSRIKRAQVETVQPVLTLTAEQIQQEGFQTVYDALNNLNQQGQVEADTQWGSHTPNASPLNLRGLGPGRTLMLVNGRRVPDYPLPYGGESNFSNFSNIPSSAVERVDILTGGASAIYGSDAVAGVVNVILKDDYQGDHLRLRTGTATEGGRHAIDAEETGGRAGDNWSLTWALQANRRDPLTGRDRPELDNADDNAWSNWNEQARKYGYNPGTGLVLVDSANRRYVSPPAGTCQRFGGDLRDAQAIRYTYLTGTTVNRGGYCGLTRDYGDWTLTTGNKDYSAYLYGTWKFTEDTEAWASFSAYQSTGTWTYSTPYFYLPSDYFQNASDGKVYALQRVFTRSEAGSWDHLANSNKELSWDLAAGLRGTWAGRFDWDFSLDRSRYEIDQYEHTVDFARATAWFLGPQLGSSSYDGETIPIHELNLQRWYAPLSTDQYAALTNRSKSSAYSWVEQAAFSVSGPLLDDWAGPIQFAGVAEWARQAYALNPDPYANERYWIDTPVDTGGGERTRQSLGLEFRVPLLASVTASLAGRYDRYGDYQSYASDLASLIGSQRDTTWSAGLEWRPYDTLLLRANYATSFRAPDMHYVLGEPSSDHPQVLDQYRCITSGAYLTANCIEDNSDVYYQTTLNRRGTPDLESETGHSFTGGFIWDLGSGMSLSMGYWQIKLQDMIRDLDRDQILSDEAGCRTGMTTNGGNWTNPGGAGYCADILARVQRGSDGRIVSIERGPINLAREEVSGIDASFKYALKTAGWGNFDFSLDYTNQFVYREQINRSDPNPNRRDERVRTRSSGNVHWTQNDGPWDINAFFSRIGSVRVVNWGSCVRFDDGFQPSPGNDCLVTDPANPHHGQATRRDFARVGPAIYWNLNAGYRVNANARLNFYVNNVFNNAGWKHKEPYYGYNFYNTMLYNPIGREVAVEYVFDF